MPKFEVGVVYKKGSRLFIATDPSSLVSCRGGQANKIRPTTDYSPIRSISVEAICERWELSLDQFDELMAGQISTPQTIIKTRPRGARRKKTDDDEYWREHRTGRLVRSKL